MFRIKVPATTANLGPGFDSLGLAFKLYSYFTFKKSDKPLIITGCDEKYQNENNLVYYSFKKTFEYMNLPLMNVEINIESSVPVCRGLGSSATCIVGGVLGASILSGKNLPMEEIFKICNSIEGHPDNIAPALFGGLTVSLVENDIPYTVKYNISKDLNFYVFIPDFELSTEKARNVLPKEISFKDSVYNISRTGVLLKALELGDEKLIKISLSDKLHQQYRLPLINESSEIIKICNSNNVLGTVISGAGPTLLGITKNSNLINEIFSQVKLLNNNWKIKKLDVDFSGTIIEYL